MVCHLWTQLLRLTQQARCQLSHHLSPWYLFSWGCLLNLMTRNNENKQSRWRICQNSTYCVSKSSISLKLRNQSSQNKYGHADKRGDRGKQEEERQIEIVWERRKHIVGIFININMLDSQEKHYIVSKLLRAILSSKSWTDISNKTDMPSLTAI